MAIPYSSPQPQSLGQLNNVQIDTSTLVNDEVIAFSSASNTWKNVNAGTTHLHNEISQLNSSVIVTDTGANGLISFTTDGVLEASINTANGLNLVTSKLTVAGVDGNAGDVLTSDGTNVSWVAPATDNEISQLNSSVIVTDTGANGLVTTTIDGTVASTIDSVGLGIGTTTPAVKLDIKETTSNIAGEIILGGSLALDDIPFGKFNFANTAAANAQTNKILASIAGEKVGSSNQGELTFATSNSASPAERMRITAEGNVGIGTLLPGVELDVVGDIRTDREFIVWTGTTEIGSIGSQAGVLDIRSKTTRDVGIGSATSPQALFIEGTNGRVGIGTITPTTLLDVAGGITGQSLNVIALNTAPASASAAGVLGEIRVTASYIYVCSATNTWVRTALATW